MIQQQQQKNAKLNGLSILHPEDDPTFPTSQTSTLSYLHACREVRS